MRSGIIRRIDDLGRIVIPKEIRKSMHIKEGDPLEISVKNNRILLETYRPLRNINSVSRSFIQRFYRQFGVPIALCDLYSIVQAQGDFFSKDTPLHEELADRVRNANASSDTPLLIDENGQTLAYMIIPIAYRSDIWGCILLPANDSIAEASACARYIANTIADYLSSNN